MHPVIYIFKQYIKIIIIICNIMIVSGASSQIFSNYIDITNVCGEHLGAINVAHSLFPKPYYWADTGQSGSRFDLFPGIYTAVVEVSEDCKLTYDISIVDISSGCNIVFEVHYNEDGCSGTIEVKYFSGGIEIHPSSYYVTWGDNNYDNQRLRPFILSSFSVINLCATITLTTTQFQNCCTSSTSCQTLLSRLCPSLLPIQTSFESSIVNKNDQDINFDLSSLKIDKFFIYDFDNCGDRINLSDEFLIYKYTKGSIDPMLTDKSRYFKIKFSNSNFWSSIRNASFIAFDFDYKNLKRFQSKKIGHINQYFYYISVFDTRYVSLEEVDSLGNIIGKEKQYRPISFPALDLNSSLLIDARSKVVSKAINLNHSQLDKYIFDSKDKTFHPYMEKHVLKHNLNKVSYFEDTNVEEVLLYLRNCSIPISLREVKHFEKHGQEINELSIKFFPNPFDSEVIMTLNSDINFEISVIVYDGIGKLVKQYEKQYIDGINELTFDMFDFPTGFYYWVVISNDLIMHTQKLVKVK